MPINVNQHFTTSSVDLAIAKLKQTTGHVTVVTPNPIHDDRGGILHLVLDYLPACHLWGLPSNPTF